MSLKTGAEGGRFNPYPGGEVSRWDDAPKRTSPARAGLVAGSA